LTTGPFPDPTQCNTKLEPINPAPPVTKIPEFIGTSFVSSSAGHTRYY
jgi:hypothetical protein